MKTLLYIALLTAGLALSVSGNDLWINRGALGLFKPLPANADSETNRYSKAKLELGKMLYHDKRLSKNRTVSCNTCHDLSSFGDDGAPTSTGIKNQKGGRSAPTVYNAAIHLAQFWDGRAADVEAQAIGPILNPIEMGMPDEKYVLKVLNSIPGYVEAFKSAFPEQSNPVTYKNVGNAIGVFERRLLTPAPWDQFLKGDESALTDRQKQGFNLFISKGCSTCHNGAGVGGHMYQKLGLVKPWPTSDIGRAEVEGFEAFKGFFKVPSLRNITETGPYLHDGSIGKLDEMVKKMAEHQVGQTLTDEETALIIDFLSSLKGEINPEDLAMIPKLPADGPKTPPASE